MQYEHIKENKLRNKFLAVADYGQFLHNDSHAGYIDRMVATALRSGRKVYRLVLNKIRGSND